MTNSSNKTSKKTRVEEIIKFFGFKNMDDATERLSEAIYHPPRGRYKSEVDETKETVSHVYSRTKDEDDNIIEKKDYMRPLVHCKCFSFLLKEIGDSLGNPCNLYFCKPDYIKNQKEEEKPSPHFLIYDKKEKVFRDPYIYEIFFDKKNRKDVSNEPIDREVYMNKKRPMDMNNIPRKQLGKYHSLLNLKWKIIDTHYYKFKKLTKRLFF